MNNAFNHTRRNLLKTFAASGLSKALISSSPLISGILLTRQAEAQGIHRPNKSIVIYIPGGAIRQLWEPTGSGADMVLKAMSSGYEKVKTECNFLLNMSHESAGHGRMPRLLSNRWSGADTYDVQMGKQLSLQQPHTYLNLGVHSNGQGYLTYEGNTAIPFQENPFNVFRLLFGANTGGSRKTPILDAHTEALNVIKHKLAGYEVARLNEHLDAIADTRRRLNELAGGNHCSDAPDNTEFALTYDTFSQQARLQADIAVAALKCQITSSVSIAFGNHQCEFRISELNYQGNYHQSIHGGSQGQANYPYYTEVRNHLSSLSAYIIQKLRDANILDSTIVVETTDMGNADTHGASDVPFLLAGGGNAIRRGVTTPVGSGYNQLDVLHTAAAACGVTLNFGRIIPGVLTT